MEKSPESCYHIAITQLLIANGLITDDDLKGHLNEVLKDFTNDSYNPKPLSEVFSKINMNLRKMSLEIRSVVVKSDQGLIYYHGIANTEVSYVDNDSSYI